MNSVEIENPGAGSSQAKPCTICRRRKVKCDKLRPRCSNCARAKQVCTYESVDGRSDSMMPEASQSQSSDNELRERLSRLEQLMAKMMLSGNATSRASPEVANQALPNSGAGGTSSPGQRALPHSNPLSIASPQYPESEDPIGHIVFKEGYGAYFDQDFWPALIAEVEDLRQIFDDGPNDEEQWASYAAVALCPQTVGSGLTLVHPTIAESNILCKYFFECVNPFVRGLHQGLFARELKEYRRGTFANPPEFEALLFAIYTLIVNNLRPDVVEKVYSCSKGSLLARFRYSTQVALAKINFLQSNKVHALSALLHYLTFLFQTNLYKEGIALLGSAVRIAQNMGIHRDPNHFPFSPWVCEIRRRMWNHLCVLDALALTSYGGESCLPATSDTRPPQNANDSDWPASRFAKPSSVPPSIMGFTDMAFALVSRELADMSRELSKISCKKYDQKESLIQEIEESINERYLVGMDSTNQSHTIVAALTQVRLAAARLPIRYSRSKESKSALERHSVFISALELLESLEYHSNVYAPLSWEWVFQDTIPWLAVAIVLTEFPKATDQLEIQRAQLHIEQFFQRFSTAPISSTPMWVMLVKLRQYMQEDPEVSQLSVSSFRGSGAPSPGSGIGPAALVYTDDSMLDFGNAGVAADGTWNNDRIMIQDGQEYPWVSAEMQFGSGSFGMFQNQQQE